MQKVLTLSFYMILLVATCADDCYPFQCAVHSTQYENKPEKISLDTVSQMLPTDKYGRFNKSPTRVDARYIQAFLVCEADFKKSSLGSKANMGNYEGIYFWEDEKYYYVIFISRKLAPKQRPGKVLLDGEKIFGQDTRYLVRKGDFSIAKRTFVSY